MLKRASCFLLLLLLNVSALLAAGGVARATPPPRTFRNALNQQGMQSILQSIEDRLRNLDQLYELRYATRTDRDMDQYVRKIEHLETKLSRIESLLDVQMEKISENMSSKNFKDDITRDQVFRKIDSLYERINHKLSYVEGKFDMDVLKLQSKIESAISRIERLDHSISVRQADIEAEVTEGIEIMENVKSSLATMDNKLVNSTKNTMLNLYKSQSETMNAKLANVTSTMTSFEKTFNDTIVQCSNGFNIDKVETDKHESVVKIINAHEDKITNYGNKMTNMYNELWKKANDIEKSVKTTEKLLNSTNKNIDEKMSKLFVEMDNKRMPNDDQNDATLEIIVDSFTNTLHRKFTDIGRKLESNFHSVLLSQNLLLESCHRIQTDELQLENKISLVLEKLLDSFVNKSAITFREIQNMEELIKSHDSHMYRSLNQNTNTIIKLSEKTSEDRKKIEAILSAIKHDVGSSLITIQDALNSENQGSTYKFETISNILQVLQEQITDLDNRINEDNMTDNSKHILEDILLQTKALLNKDNFIQQFNSTVIKTENSVTMIENLMKNIFYILNNIESKLNKTYLDYIFSNRQEQKVQKHIGKVPKSNIERLNDISPNKIESSSDNIKNDTEIIDIVLRMLPENNTSIENFLNEDSDLIKRDDKMFLSRFNYTTIYTETENVTNINSQVTFNKNNTKTEENLHNISYNDTIHENYTDTELDKKYILDLTEPFDLLKENSNSTTENVNEFNKHDINEDKETPSTEKNQKDLKESNFFKFFNFLPENESKNHTNEEAFSENTSDSPDIPEYDEDYDDY